MIISQFSIHEVYPSGEEFFMNPHDVQQVVSSIKQIFTDVTTGLIALRMERCSSLEIRVPFIFLRDDEDPRSVGANWIFDGNELTKVFYNNDDEMVNIRTSELCYFIRTSGTTDIAKLVGVPYSCIEPNIEDFRERFSITSEDVILCSTSLFFDPSIVDIFLCFMCASQLLLVPDSTRSQPHLLSNILRKFRPSFVQVFIHFNEGGTRRCWINGVLSDEFVSTGDTADVIGNEFFIAGRKDEQVKFNGIRCNLALLSQLISTLDGVSFAHFIIYKEKFLVLFVLSNSPIEDRLRNIIPVEFIPSKVIYLDQIPVNKNGKTDRSEMIALLEKQCFLLMNSKASILTFLNKFGIKDSTSLSHSFVDFVFSFGIQSAEAAEIALHLGQVEALHDILSPSLSIENVLEKYVVGMKNANGENSIVRLGLTKDVPISVEVQPTVKWAYNTGKCIDGTPLYITSLNIEVIVVSSHSGIIICLRVQDGYCLWKANFPCRFEASPELCGRYICVGGFNGNIYFLSVDTGNSEWCFPTGDVIKAPCAIDEDNFAYVPSYDRTLYKLDPQSGSPAKVILWENAVLLTTVNGYVEALDQINGTRLWIYQATAPVFSSVTIFDQMCFICSVDGMITKLGRIDGKKQLCGTVREPVFSSPIVLDGLLYIASQSGSLFILNQSLMILRHFRFAHCSFVVAPILFNSYFLSLVSSCGLLLLFSESSCKAWGFRLGAGQVYSRVVISQENMCFFAGCRDDWIRCFEFPKLLY
ncbi:PQQ enzyme repeat protein [Dictyocaulus viviparus]|uniref:PQQ enzyme repeat protein n=1 Tax=Dictyocaulus viviparus TaxID=29172 RepID=A0A0D8XAF7_DICVI|nr:PQQ enzyme repeat protein [Dictyocaulus viviparus]